MSLEQLVQENTIFLRVMGQCQKVTQASLKRGSHDSKLLQDEHQKENVNYG